MAEVLDLLLKKIVTAENILQWMQNHPIDMCHEALQEHPNSQKEFVVNFLNFIRHQVNSVSLSTSTGSSHSVQTLAQSTAFPLECIRYVSPRKQIIPNGSTKGSKSHIKLNFTTPNGKSSTLPLKRSLKSPTVSGDNSNCLDRLLEEDVNNSSMLESNKLFSRVTPNTNNVSFSNMATSTPVQSPILPDSERRVYDVKPANYNRRESLELLGNKNRKDSFKDGDRNYYSTPKTNENRYQSQNKKNNHHFSNGNYTKKHKKKLTLGDCFTNSPNNLTDASLSVDLNDEKSFPPMLSNSQSRSNNKKKKRIKPTAINFCSVSASKERSVLFNKEETNDSVFQNAVESPMKSFDHERNLLKEFKKNLQLSSSSNRKDEGIQFPKKEGISSNSPCEFKSHTKVSYSDMSVQQLVKEEENCCTTEVTHSDTLVEMISIYSALVLTNAIPSLMMELNMTFQLLTVRSVQPKDNEEFKNTPLLFSSTHNCVYFSSHFLSSIRNILKFFDKSFIKLLCDNRRLKRFTPDFHAYLSSLMASLQNVQSPKQPPKSPMKSVPFQSDTDNRANFPDDTTFHQFRKQRDLFYELLREWERQHTNPGWSVGSHLGDKIRSLLEMGPEPCNVSHLARLYVSQLLNMCDSAYSVSQEDVTNSILSQLRRQHPEKFERLHQRLTVPSTVTLSPTTGPSFPGVQAFFRSFLLEAYNPTFCTHLEDVLIAKFSELLGIGTDCKAPSIRSRSTAGLSVWLRQCGTVGKFIGLLWFSSYTTALPSPQPAIAAQLACRSKKLPSVDLVGVVQKGALSGHLVGAVLSCVQVLSTADEVALHTPHFLTVVCILLHIHRMVQCSGSPDHSGSVNSNPSDNTLPNSSKVGLKTPKSVSKKTLHCKTAASTAESRVSALADKATATNFDLSLLQPQARLFLRFILGWLFDMPVFPSGLFYTDPLQMEINLKDYQSTLHILSTVYRSKHTALDDAQPVCLKTPSKNKMTVAMSPEPFRTPQGPLQTPLKTGTPFSPLTLQDTPLRLVDGSYSGLSSCDLLDQTYRPIGLDTAIVMDYQLLQEWCPQVAYLKQLLTDHNQHAASLARRMPVTRVLSDNTVTVYKKITPLSSTLKIKPKKEQTVLVKEETSKDIQNLLEESFFHTQRECVRECVQFLTHQFVTNSIRALRDAVIPSLVTKFSKVMQESLQKSFDADLFKSTAEVESSARSLIHGLTVSLREAVKSKCLESNCRALSRGSRLGVMKTLLPCDTPHQAVLVSCAVSKRVSMSRITTWLDANLSQAVPSDLLTSTAVKIVRNYLSNKNFSEVSQLDLHISIDMKKTDENSFKKISVSDVDSIPECEETEEELRVVPLGVKTEGFSVRAGGDKHSATAPIPSILMSELKALMCSIERYGRAGGTLKVKSSILQHVEKGAVPSISGYREKNFRGKEVPLTASHLVTLSAAIDFCCEERGDLTPPVFKGLQFLSVDILSFLCILKPSLITDRVLDSFTSLWREGGNLERPATLLNTLLSPRILSMAERMKVKEEAWSSSLLLLIERCLQERLLQKEELQQKCIELLQHSWSQSVLSSIGFIASKLETPSDDNSVMSWLPWICEEMENYEE